MPPQEKAPVTQDNEKSLENNNACDMELVPTNNGYTNEGFVKECNTNDDQKRPNDEEKKNEAFEFDDLLPHIGEFGIYQKILFLLMIPFAFFVAWVYFTQIFITIIPEQHWCLVPELANLTTEARLDLLIFYY